MALASAKCFSANIYVLKVMSNDWYDVETNKVIPQTKIGEITNRLIDAGRLIDDPEKGLGRCHQIKWW